MSTQIAMNTFVILFSIWRSPHPPSNIDEIYPKSFIVCFESLYNVIAKYIYMIKNNSKLSSLSRNIPCKMMYVGLV